MISLKSFVTAIHDALIGASNTLMKENEALLDKYFIENPAAGTVASGEGGPIDKKALVPRTVTLTYPHMTADGTMQYVEVAVPLITLVPLTLAQVDKAKFTANFEMEVVDGELQLNFANTSRSLFKRKTKTGNLEITLSHQDTPEGLRLVVEGYDAILKRQIS